MLKISDVVSDIITKNPYLEFGLVNQLFNITQLSRFIQPMVEVRLKKETSTSAIGMCLSRLQQQKVRSVARRRPTEIENITIQSNLVAYTFYKTQENEKALQTLVARVNKRNGYYAVMRSMNEFSLILEKRLDGLLKENFSASPKSHKDNVAALGLKFPKKYAEEAGVLYSVLRALSFQNINIIETCSTYSEFVVYVDRKDVRLAFETLERAFVEDL